MDTNKNVNNPWGFESGTVLRRKSWQKDLFVYTYDPNHGDEQWYLWNGSAYVSLEGKSADDYTVVNRKDLKWWELDQIR